MIEHFQDDIGYFLSDEMPRVLIASGIHGDEWKVIEPVKNAVERLSDQLPPFIFIPEMSPTAVAAQTRANGYGNDLNRIFGSDTLDPEKTALQEIVQEFPPFNTVLTIHEDLFKEEAYLYDGCQDFNDTKIQSWKSALQVHGVKLLNGRDADDDPVLGVGFVDGYFNFHPKSDTFIETFESWCSLQAGANRNITLEIPGLADAETRKYILEQSLLALL